MSSFSIHRIHHIVFFNELTAFKNTLILSRVLNSTLAQPAFSQLDAHIHPSSHYLLNILFTCSIFSLMAVAENFVTLYRMFYLNRSSQKIPSKLFLIPENTSSRSWMVDPGGSGSTLLPPLHYFLSDYCTFFNVRKYLQFERNMKNMKYETRYARRFVPILREALSDITNPFWLLRWEQNYGNLLSRDSHCEFMLQCVETVHLI